MKYFLYFIIYSFIGWLMEVVLKSKDEHKFVNRGFLIGPICPIYGFGVLLIILLVGNSKSDLLAVFLKSILVCSVLEYFTSYFMEKLFHARWWDYSKNKYNINGRICLETMLPFGILSTIVIYVVHPLVIKFVSLFSNTLLIILTILFGILLFKMPKEMTAMSLTMMLSIVLLFYGVEKISLSRKLRYIGLFHSYTYSFNGMMTITLGILFMILPMTSVFIIDYIIASYFLVSGISLFIETIHMKTI